MAQVINMHIVLRNDTSANWEAHSDQILLKGEVGVEFLPSGEKKMKIGDGVTPWANLGYFGGGSGDVDIDLLESITQESVDRWNAAQPNTIEKIFVNGNELPIADKKVDIFAATIDHNHDGIYLKANETIPAALLPSYVDDVVEFESVDVLPTIGEAGKIYVTTNNNKTYRWSGSQYVEIANGIALGETAETAFRGDLGKVAYDHAISEHAPVNAQENVIEIFKVGGEIIPVKPEKTVVIPIATEESFGVVKSSSGPNKVTVEADGTMTIKSVSASSLAMPADESLVLDGGSSDGADPVYPGQIGGVGYNSVSDAIAAANDGDVVTLRGVIDMGSGDNDHVVISKNIGLDLNDTTVTASGENGAINVVGGNVAISGDGTIAATLGSANYSMAVWASSGKVEINGGTFTNETDGSIRGTDLIYASGNAQIEINGGTFIAAKPKWTLNCKDADYKSGIANIVVKGGRFYKFDPANNDTEGLGTNYVADGYQSVLEGDYYVVKPV